MKIKALGHVVLRVTDRDRAERFYGDLLGLPLCARFDEGGLKMAFFSLGNSSRQKIGSRLARASGQHQQAQRQGQQGRRLRRNHQADPPPAPNGSRQRCQPGRREFGQQRDLEKRLQPMGGLDTRTLQEQRDRHRKAGQEAHDRSG